MKDDETQHKQGRSQQDNNIMQQQCQVLVLASKSIIIIIIIIIIHHIYYYHHHHPQQHHDVVSYVLPHLHFVRRKGMLVALPPSRHDKSHGIRCSTIQSQRRLINSAMIYYGQAKRHLQSQWLPLSTFQTIPLFQFTEAET